MRAFSLSSPSLAAVSGGFGRRRRVAGRVGSRLGGRCPITGEGRRRREGRRGEKRKWGGGGEGVLLPIFESHFFFFFPKRLAVTVETHCHTPKSLSLFFFFFFLWLLQDTLAELFTRKNDAKLQQLENELLSISQQDMNVSQYFTKIKSLCQEISKLDIQNQITETSMRRIVIHGLHPEFNTLVAATHGWAKEPNLNELKKYIC
ncbi:hypothetical protein P3X46_001389 [Hevea brasiliensis]|uniref:Retrotransposon gag domain-containing protein n=1 Tax=Hevea brasiliensis TaxID=3981 RepID=A0ABQ9NF21_HEVBR|nr:hypothetical protein P3X46_001389 [Hevea brasiliensis]